jgi:hypothetical protein
MGMPADAPCIDCGSDNVDVDTSSPEQCEPGDHVFEVDGPTPGKCTFCGFTHEQQA